MTLLAHRLSVGLMGVAVLVATADGFAQSWSGLYSWAIGHGLSGWKAMAFPGLVDLFILVGELGLFTLALEGHTLTRRGMSWLDLAVPAGIATAGWLVSLAFNVGTHTRLADQLTAAVPPVASMLGLLVLLRTLHRVISRGVWEQKADPVPADAPGVVVERLHAPEPVPAVLGPVPDAPEAVPAVPGGLDEVHLRAAREFADEVTAGRVPGLRAIKQTLRVGQPKASQVQAYLAVLAEGDPA
jgi:hypothetical protein